MNPERPPCDFLVRFLARYFLQFRDAFLHSWPRVQIMGRSFLASTFLRGVRLRTTFSNLSGDFLQMSSKSDCVRVFRDVTLRHDLHAFSKFFGRAIKQHWARENPIGNVEIPSDEDAVRMHVLTTSEEQRYFARAAKHRDLHDLGRLMLNQGPRPDEVTSLAKADVDLERRRMFIRRGKSRAARRKLDLTAESCRILAERMAGASQWIFPSSRNPDNTSPG